MTSSEDTSVTRRNALVKGGTVAGLLLGGTTTMGVASAGDEHDNHGKKKVHEKKRKSKKKAKKHGRGHDGGPGSGVGDEDDDCDDDEDDGGPGGNPTQ